MNTRAVAVFLAVAFGLAYLLDAVIAATGSLGTALGLGLLLARMFTPLIATVVVCRWVTGQPWSPAVGLGRATFAAGGWRRVLLWCLAGIGLVLLAVLMSFGVAVLGGWLHPDWAMTATMRDLRDAGAGALPPPPVFTALLVVQAVLAGATLNALFGLGEEAGWRGWLHTELEPLGFTRLILVTGVVWGLWHAPLIAMGYNYEHQLHPLAAVGLFTLFCVAFGAVLTWLRQASASVIPAAVAHGVFNALTTLPAVFIAPGDSWDRVLAGPVGLPAALILAVIAAALWLPGRRRVTGRALSR